MDNYEKLLDKAIKEKPENCESETRCDIPKVTGRIQGNTTIITNFNQICKFLNRDQQHFIKFLLRELATPGKLDDSRLVLNRKLNPKLINEKIELYAKIYVFCSECGKPDTQLINENGKLYLKCMACGTRKNVKEKI